MPLASKSAPEPTIVLYDGWCSLCSKSSTKLTKMDAGQGRLRMVDLRKEDQLLKEHDLDAGEVRRVMHAITPDGGVLVAMNAVRETMRVLGRGWMVSWTKLPIARWITDRLYIGLANNRLRWFGKSVCTDGSCSVSSESNAD